MEDDCGLAPPKSSGGTGFDVVTETPVKEIAWVDVTDTRIRRALLPARIVPAERLPTHL